MKAFELLSDPRRFKTGTCYSDAKGKPCLPADGPVSFDALGAIFFCYPNGKHEDIAQPNNLPEIPGPCRRARELAKSKYHKRLGQLEYDEALEVFKEAGV